MKTKHLYIKNKEGVIEQLEVAKAIAAGAKELELKKPEFTEAVTHFLKGNGMDDLDFDVIADPEDKKAQKALYKAAEKFVADSARNKEALNKQIAEEEEAKQKAGVMIVKASEDGYEAAQKFELATASGIQKLVGSKFVVTEHGLSVAKDVTLTPVDVAKTVTALAGGSEGASKVRSKFLIALGDAVVLTKAAFGEQEGEDIIAQAISEDGQGKHMVMQSEPVMAYITELYPDQSERPTGLSFSHLLEAKNYGRNKKGEHVIPKAKVKGILKKAQEEKLSCADMRELLKKARPQDDENEDDGGGGEGDEIGGGENPTSTQAKALYGYTYLNLGDTDKVHFSEELDEEKLKAVDDAGDQKYLVFDLSAKAVLKQTGKVSASFVE